MLEVDYAVARFADNAEAIQNLVRGVSDEQARWKPSPEEWSILEVVNHLYDEERLDFRRRLGLLLQDPDQPWPPIDPQGWVTERGYNNRDLAASLADFQREREGSLAWLRGLDTPDWEIYKEHPLAGKFRAGDLLAAWLAHDLLHLRQLTQLHYQYLNHGVAPYASDYAGTW
jgi:hypothetical protein